MSLARSDATKAETVRSAPTHPEQFETTPADADIALRRYREALARTNALIERAPTPEGKSLAEIRARAEFRMGRLRDFLAYLGNPHDQYPIVHVGGTSGKGSTSTAIAAILTAAGYRAGLHTSPYLQVATEKLQIDGRLIAGERFGNLVDEVLAAVDAWAGADGGPLPLTYGEVWMAILSTYFAQEQVDVAVIEVGAGGRFDLTNLVRPTVSVITSVGLDHTVTLGSTIAEIAWHKAGIIKHGIPVVTAVQDPVALTPILEEASTQEAEVIRVQPGTTYEFMAESGDGVRWRELGGQRQELVTALPGRFQAVNAATAVAAARALARTGFVIPEEAVQAGLLLARIPGRCEAVQREPRVILDGAHNPDKVATLAAELPTLAGRPPGGRLIAVVGMLESKEHRAMIDLLAPAVDDLVLTTPRVLAKPGALLETLEAAVRASGFDGTVIALAESDRAMERALAQARSDRGDVILVTGSLYLVGNLRGRWYADDEVVVQRTPWPRSDDDKPPLPTESADGP